MGNKSLFAALQGTNNGPFNPSRLPGLTFWLKADSLALSDGASVTSWADSSTSGIVFTDGTGHPPTYKANILNGKPVVRFNSSDPDSLSYLTPFNPCPSNLFSVFVVMTPNTSSTTYPTVFNFFGDSSSLRPYQLGLQYSGSGTDWTFYNAFAQPSGTWYNSADVNLTIGSPYILGFVGTNANITPYLNGTAGSAVALVQQCAFGAGPLWLGSYNGSQFDFEHDIAEIIIYNGALSSSQAALVQSYLNSKYAIY